LKCLEISFFSILGGSSFRREERRIKISNKNNSSDIDELTGDTQNLLSLGKQFFIQLEKGEEEKTILKRTPIFSKFRKNYRVRRPK
jgi:hypothetical protein